MPVEPYGREGITLEEARQQILDALTPLTATEMVDLPQGLGRVPVHAVQASSAVPGFRASIMDGYAVGGEGVAELGQRWRLIGCSAAGAPFAEKLQPGDAIRILTGAVVPEGCHRVVPQELMQRHGDEIELVKACGTNPWIRHPEEETAKGDVIVPSGNRLGVADLGRLASCGIQTVKVARKPTVGLLISGDELRPPGAERALGQIWESNSTLLIGMLQRLGYPVIEQRIVPDQPEALRSALVELADRSDVVVTTGGVSAGDTDWIRTLVEELGEVSFWKLFLKPGRPFAWGWIENTPFFGLPGNPVAATLTALQLLWPALQVLEGAEVELLPRLKIRLEAEMRRAAGRPELARARLVVATDGSLWARVDGSQASSRIGSLQGADLLLEIPAECGTLPAGTELWAQLLHRPLMA